MNDNKFVYKYSAPTKEERREIEDIKRRYGTQENTNDKLARIRKLDARVKNAPMALSITLGVVGVLVFGLGLTMILEWQILVWGIVVMALGCIPMAFAYKAYSLLFDRNKKKYGEEILKLSDELLNEKNIGEEQ